MRISTVLVPAVIAVLCAGRSLGADDSVADRATRIADMIRTEAPGRRGAALEEARVLVREITLAPRKIPSRPALVAVVEKLVPSLVAALEDSDPKARFLAAASLSYLTVGPVCDEYLAATSRTSISVDVGLLVRALQDEQTSNVTSLLFYVRPLPKEAVAPLSAVFWERKDGDVQAARVLAHAGEDARAVLVEAILDQSAGAGWRRSSAVIALREVLLSDREVEKLLKAAETSQDEDIQASALTSLKSTARAEAPFLKRVERWLDADSRSLRGAAALVLGKGGPGMRHLLPRLEALLKSDHSAVEVAEAIADLGPTKEMLDTLVAVVRDDAAFSETRRHALRALTTLGRAAQSALPAVEKRLQQLPSGMEREAAKAARDALVGSSPARK